MPMGKPRGATKRFWKVGFGTTSRRSSRVLRFPMSSRSMLSTDSYFFWLWGIGGLTGLGIIDVERRLTHYFFPSSLQKETS